jgi:hypothetical protein
VFLREQDTTETALSIAAPIATQFAKDLATEHILNPLMNKASKIFRKDEKKVIKVEQQALAALARSKGRALPPIPQQSNRSQPSSTAPVAFARVQRQRRPRITMGKRGEVCTVRHSEYIGEVTGSTNFATTSYAVNPALPNLFAWLANIAARFEQYKFKKLNFRVETENPTSQGGSVMIAVDYDVLDSAPLTKQALMAYKSAVRTAPWERVDMPLDLANDGGAYSLRYTRTGAIPTNADQKTYDLCDLYIATQNCNGASLELYVDYEVELHTPQFGNPIGAGNISSLATQTNGMTAGSPFGTSGGLWNQVVGSPGWVLSNDGKTFTCQYPGKYLCSVTAESATVISTGWTDPPTGTATINYHLSPSLGGSNTSAAQVLVVTALAGQTLVLTLGGVTVGSNMLTTFRSSPYSNSAN